MNQHHDLTTLTDLHRRGILSDADFVEAKARIGVTHHGDGQYRHEIFPAQASKEDNAVVEGLQDKVALLELQNELSALRERGKPHLKKYIVRDQYGREVLLTPSRSTALIVATCAVLGTLFALWVLLSSTPFVFLLLSGAVTFLAVKAVQAEYRKVNAFEAEQTRFLAQEQELEQRIAALRTKVQEQRATA
jgi:hypothetical protein